MNQSTHAWLAVNAYKILTAYSNTNNGKSLNLQPLIEILGNNLHHAVVGAWIPDALIKDMTYGHVFKNSAYTGNQTERFTLSFEDLKKKLPIQSHLAKTVLPLVDADFWKHPYRVKENGGHLPARVNAMCQTVRDMLKMSTDDISEHSGSKVKGSSILNKSLLFTAEDIAITMWTLSHYVADAHMPHHCDNRKLASTSAAKKLHCEIEDVWGKQLPSVFMASAISKGQKETLLKAEMPSGSKFGSLDFGDKVCKLRNGGDPWTEAVYICRSSFAVSFAWVPANQAPVDDQKTQFHLKELFQNNICGEDRFWKISECIMHDAVNAIAMFWLDSWNDFTKATSKDENV